MFSLSTVTGVTGERICMQAMMIRTHLLLHPPKQTSDNINQRDERLGLSPLLPAGSVFKSQFSFSAPVFLHLQTRLRIITLQQTHTNTHTHALNLMLICTFCSLNTDTIILRTKSPTLDLIYQAGYKEMYS